MFDARVLLERLVTADAALDGDAATDWRAELSDSERRLFPADSEPPGNFVRTVLAVRRAFDGEIISVRWPERELGPTDIRPDDLSDPWRAWYEERAAIREYDGGQAREHAEADALRETIDTMRTAGEHPPTDI